MPTPQTTKPKPQPNPAPATTLNAVDWQAPWLADWRATARPILEATASGDSLHVALNASPGPVRFVAADALPSGTPYEAFIAQTKQVPTRENLHDALNALAWLQYPQTKAMLNRLQGQEIAERGIGGTRGKLRDAITVFDENGAVLWGERAAHIARALAERRWLNALHDPRASWLNGGLRISLFGHALLEKLAAPRLNITAHVIALRIARPCTAPERDCVLAAALRAKFEAQASSEGIFPGRFFVPLPVLGVPGWHPSNAEPVFYAQADVFRLP